MADNLAPPSNPDLAKYVAAHGSREGATFRLSLEHQGWQLATIDGRHEIRAVRNVMDEEVAALNAAVGVLREHISAQPTNLLLGARAALRATIDAFPTPTARADSMSNLILERVALPVVTWLLFWRLQRDNLTAGLNRRSRGDANKIAAFEDYKRAVFDANPSYRLAEGLRDYVQHYAFPPISITRGAHVGPGGVLQPRFDVVINAASLLAWGALKVPLKRDLIERDKPLHLLASVDEAMDSMRLVTEEYERLLADSIQTATTRFGMIANETAPSCPVLVQVGPHPNSDRDRRITMTRFDDVYAWYRSTSF